MPILGSNELLEDVHNRELCIGCGACVDICPYFKNYKGKTAQLFPCTLEQGRCYAYCPKAEVDLDALSQHLRGVPYDGSPLGAYREVLAARAGEKLVKGVFQGGGTVSALVTFGLQTGLIDAAALTDRQALTPVARIVTDWKDVAEYATSKFMASPTVSSVNLAVRQGHQRIGVVGTPCQMVAIAQMHSNPLGKDEHKVPLAFSVGLFCNWSLDTRQLIDLLSDKLDITDIRGMDIPPPPANIMILDTGDGRVEISLSEIKPLIPHTCFICPDMTSEWADVSVGVLEGKSDWNTLIIRTERGADLVKAARKAGFLITEQMPPQTLQHLCVAAAGKKKRALERAKTEGLLNTRGEDQRAALRISEKVVENIARG